MSASFLIFSSVLPFTQSGACVYETPTARPNIKANATRATAVRGYRHSSFGRGCLIGNLGTSVRGRDLLTLLVSTTVAREWTGVGQQITLPVMPGLDNRRARCQGGANRDPSHDMR